MVNCMHIIDGICAEGGEERALLSFHADHGSIELTDTWTETPPVLLV